MTRIITNVEIAKALAKEFGIQYMSQEYIELLDGVDIGRGPEEEDIPVEESIIEQYIESYRASIEADNEICEQAHRAMIREMRRWGTDESVIEQYIKDFRASIEE